MRSRTDISIAESVHSRPAHPVLPILPLYFFLMSYSHSSKFVFKCRLFPAIIRTCRLPEWQSGWYTNVVKGTPLAFVNAIFDQSAGAINPDKKTSWKTCGLCPETSLIYFFQHFTVFLSRHVYVTKIYVLLERI